MRRTGSGGKGGASMSLIMDLSPIITNVNQVPKFVDKVALTTVKFYEPQVENYARTNAPWTDRTTNARNGLRATSGREGKVFFLDLAHSVPYGIFLEVRWAGRYAIILPTLEVYGPRVMSTLQKILDRFSG